MPPLISDPPNNTEGQTDISSHESPTMWSQLEIMITDLRDQDSRTKLELETTKAKLRQQSKELQQCREQILRTIGAFQVNDQEISEELVMIRQSLYNWILVLPDINGFEDAWTRANSNLRERNLAIQAKLRLWPECPLELVETDIIFLEIFHIIWKRLLRPRLAAATKEQASLLDRLLSQIKLLKPPKDLKAIRVWRSDTCRVFTDTSQYQQQLNRYCKDIVTIISNYLSTFSFSGRIEWKPLVMRLETLVIKPAATLGTKLACSPENYSWNWRSCLHPDIEKPDIEDFDLVDCKTHDIASKATIRAIHDGSKAGRLVMPVFPELVRHAETTTVIIQKPMILVSFADVLVDSNFHSEVTIPIDPQVRKDPEDVTLKREDPSP